MNYGSVYTTGNSYRARAEARQREFRAEELEAGWVDHGHWLDEAACQNGANFVTADIHGAARERRANGKGVTKRTFKNMLSSQAMCFNVFAPLAADLQMATEVLKPFFDGIRRVSALHIEYTPSDEVFGDQSGRAGVDCDVLVEAVDRDGEARVITIETKFVEPGFSPCSHRKKKECPEDVQIQSDRSNCRYVSTNEYRYWERTRQYDLLGDGALPPTGCPFGGELWQIWVNYALAHAEADRRGAARADFAVVAPRANRRLAADERIGAFQDLFARPNEIFFLPLNRLLGQIEHVTRQGGAGRHWSRALTRRYGAI